MYQTRRKNPLVYKGLTLYLFQASQQQQLPAMQQPPIMQPSVSGPPTTVGMMGMSSQNLYNMKGVRALRGYFGPPMRPKNENCLSQVSSY